MVINFYVYNDGYDYYATPYKCRAEEYGGVLLECDADPEDFQSIISMTTKLDELIGKPVGLQFSW